MSYMLWTSAFLLNPEHWLPTERTKILFTPWLILSFTIHKNYQGFLNACISAETILISLSDTQLQGFSFKTNFFVYYCYWSSCCLSHSPTCNTVCINAVQNKIWHLPHQQVLYLMLQSIPLVSCKPVTKTDANKNAPFLKLLTPSQESSPGSGQDGVNFCSSQEGTPSFPGTLPGCVLSGWKWALHGEQSTARESFASFLHPLALVLLLLL